MKENYKTIKTFPNYQISNLGNILSLNNYKKKNGLLLKKHFILKHSDKIVE